MTTEVHELPEVGEIVVATIAKIGDHGAYATLDEYNGIQGFLHVSEIAHGWVRNVSKFVKEGEKKVLLVKNFFLSLLYKFGNISYPSMCYL
jgi:translation initiation factor 2 subunit 1